MNCEKCIHKNHYVGHIDDDHDYFGDCKHFKDKNDYELIEKAFNLLIYDVDMSSVDYGIFEKVFEEMCNKKCNDNCRECLREYYIEKARRTNN